jgi:hypothetical protein
MEQNISFLKDQLIWHPSVYSSDGSVLSTTEFFISGSPAEIERTVAAFLYSLEKQGADIPRTLSSELKNLRDSANHLSDVLRQSRSTREASENGARLKNVMFLLKVLESQLRQPVTRVKTGTGGD